MRSLLLCIGILSSGFVFAPVPSQRQEKVPEVLLVSHYVYVEALDGDILNLHLVAEDRKAIMDVENALRAWNRYMITTKRRDAELLFIVRKGRVADIHGSVGGGSENDSGGPRGSSQPRPRDDVPADLGTEAGLGDDLLYVYMFNHDGSLQGPVWKHYLKDGLGTPDIPLFKQLKETVETASKPSPSKATSP